MKGIKLIMTVAMLVGILFSMGCIQTLVTGVDMSIREVGLHGAKWEADSTEELKENLFQHCAYDTCPGMNYQYEGTKYTVYEENGKYVARDPKCICRDTVYAEKHE